MLLWDGWGWSGQRQQPGALCFNQTIPPTFYPPTWTITVWNETNCTFSSPLLSCHKGIYMGGSINSSGWSPPCSPWAQNVEKLVLTFHSWERSWAVLFVQCSIYSIKIYCCVHQLLTVFAIAVIKQVLPCERKSFKTNSDMGRVWEFLQSGFALCLHWMFFFPCCWSKDGLEVMGRSRSWHVPSLGTLGVSWTPADAWQVWGNKTSQASSSIRQFTCRNIIYKVPLRALGLRNREWEELAALESLTNSEVLEGLAAGGLQSNGWKS